MIVRMKRCPKCGLTSPRDVTVCPGCRTQFAFRAPQTPVVPKVLPPGAQWVEAPPHDVSVAACVAIFLVGAGQLYNGQKAKGFVLMAGGLILFVLALILWLAGNSWADVLLGIDLLIWFVAIFDATAVAGHRLDGEDIRPWQWF